jgi:positive regulator of sigma E activity
MLMLTLVAITLGFILDLIIGDPHSLPHPICLIGNLISWLEKGLRKIFGFSEKGLLCGGAVLVLLVTGFCFVVPFAILFVSVTVDSQTSFVVATLFGVGNLLVTFAFETPCLYVFMALACVLMNNLNRYVSAVAVVICDVLFAYLFDIYPNLSVYSLIPTFVSATAFCVVPSRVVANVADILCPKQQYSGRMVITKFCKSLSQRLYRLSDVFFAMKSTFVSMAMESVSKADAQVAIVKQVQRSVCGDCKQKNECWRNNLEKTESSLLKLTECALSRGKVTILDISPTLTFRCDRLSFILSTINTHAESFLSFIKKSKENAG